VSYVVFLPVLYISVTVHCQFIVYWVICIVNFDCFCQHIIINSCPLFFFFNRRLFLSSLSMSQMSFVKCVQGLLSSVRCLKNSIFSMSCVNCFWSCVFSHISFALCLLSYISCLVSIVCCLIFLVFYLCLLSCVTCFLSVVLCLLSTVLSLMRLLSFVNCLVHYFVVVCLVLYFVHV